MTNSNNNEWKENLPKHEFKLVTSNKEKLSEFISLGIPVTAELGLDLPEVDGTMEDVIIHKSIMAGRGHIVEDTSLFIEGADIGVNIKWLLNKASEYVGKKAIWTVMLGLNDEENIFIYEGYVEGTIVPARNISANEPKPFGFDGIFLPNGSNFTLYDLGKEKSDFSARSLAISAFLLGNPKNKILISDVPAWNGDYQNSGPSCP